MLALEPDHLSSCISAAIHAPGTPRFDFNELQQRALRLALRQVQERPSGWAQGTHLEPDWEMLRLNCYACHDRHHKGGPEDGRVVYFGQGRDRFPPSLDHVGARLGPQALKDVLHGHYIPNPSQRTVRMPDFGITHAHRLGDAFTAADRRVQ